MKLKIMKTVYFATICLPPPLLLVIYPLVFVWHAPIPFGLIAWYPFYFWIGLVLLIIDLWRSTLTREIKVRWTVLNILLGIVCLPIYWFRYLLNASPKSQRSQTGSGLNGTDLREVVVAFARGNLHTKNYLTN